MTFWDILYIICIFLFAYMTFVIVRNNFRSKFDDEGNRIEDKDKT